MDDNRGHYVSKLSRSGKLSSQWSYQNLQGKYYCQWYIGSVKLDIIEINHISAKESNISSWEPTNLAHPTPNYILSIISTDTIHSGIWTHSPANICYKTPSHNPYKSSSKETPVHWLHNGYQHTVFFSHNLHTNSELLFLLS